MNYSPRQIRGNVSDGNCALLKQKDGQTDGQREARGYYMSSGDHDDGHHHAP